MKTNGIVIDPPHVEGKAHPRRRFLAMYLDLVPDVIPFFFG